MAKTQFMPTNSRQIAIVYETPSYDTFKHIKGNRRLDKKHIKRLSKSMQKRLLLTPLIIDANGYIKDGQHRFEARKALGLPIPYIIDGLNGGKLLTDVQTYNSASRNWSLINYIESQCELGNENYKHLHRILVDYPAFKPITMITILLNKGETKAPTKGFKEGLFKFPASEVKRVTGVCAKIANFGDHFQYYSDRRFVTAAMQLIRTKGYDHDYLLKKLSTNELVKKSSVYDYWYQLVGIYNSYHRNKLNFQFHN